LVQYDAMRCYTDTHDPSLSVIPTAKQPFAGITLLLKVAINGHLSSQYKVTRGVRQGDPLSCALFNLAIEPLAC
jgi:hypothetical protein